MASAAREPFFDQIGRSPPGERTILSQLNKQCWPTVLLALYVFVVAAREIASPLEA
jgi:hypothetical protein